jgi:L-threonylcarbamoyladenylate synthase
MLGPAALNHIGGSGTMGHATAKDAMPASTREIERAAELLKQGELVAFPTETVYGLGADATNDRAVAAVFEAKGRPSFNPLISHVDSLTMAERLGTLNADAMKLARAYWPGPLTLVVPRAAECPVSLLACAGLATIAVRVPRHPVANQLLQRVARPLVAPSANSSGKLSPTLASHVKADLGAKVAAVLDGGPCPLGIESTVVSCIDDNPRILRPGGLVRASIEQTLGREVAEGASQTEVLSPGQLASHYAPRARVILNVIWPRYDVGLLAFGPEVPRHPGPVRNLSPTGDLREAAANLFRMLHELDDAGVETIACMTVPDIGLGEAVNDRLRRAAAPFHR